MPVITKGGRHFLVSREGLIPVAIGAGGLYRPLDPVATPVDPERIEQAVQREAVKEAKAEQLDIASEMDKILTRIKGHSKK